MGKYFGTDGVRGIAGEKLTCQLAYNLGKAGAQVLGSRGGESKQPLILVGRDTRISGPALEQALMDGIEAAGGRAVSAGVIPTPAVALLAQKYGAQAGVVISASHNSYEYNGIKFFGGSGFKLDDELELAIEDLLDIMKDAGDLYEERPALHGCTEISSEHTARYVEFLESTIDIDLKGYKICLDCANGASYMVAPEVFRALGAEVVVIGNQPDGENINLKCGSTKPSVLCQAVVREAADCGFAFDGDADRIITVDNLGREVDGDREMCIMAAQMKREGTLNGNTVTATIMSNIGFHRYMESIGCGVFVTGVGDRRVIEKMLAEDCRLGGEQSGHIICTTYQTTGDGVMAALQLMKALAADGRTMAELADDITLYPQVLVNARIAEDNKKYFCDNGDILDPEVKKRAEDMVAALAGEGRVLIRPSGTEPLVRVTIEGKDQKEIEKLAGDMAAYISERFA